MLSAPKNNIFPNHDGVSHLNNRHRSQSATLRLSTWDQIKSFIYKSMINDDKSNSEWIYNELSSFEEIIRKEFPKDVVPIIMDDHIRSVLTKYPQNLHKSILKLLFSKIPKLKPATLFIIPSSPKHNNKNNNNHNQFNHNNNNNKTPSFTPTPIMKHRSSDSSLINLNSSNDDNIDNMIDINDKETRIIITKILHEEDENILSTKLSHSHSQSNSDQHQYTSSMSDSNHLFSPNFKKPIGLNLTEDNNSNTNTNTNTMNNNNNNINNNRIKLSPSASSMIDGFEYHQEIQSDDDQDDDHDDPVNSDDDIIITMAMDTNDTDENETNYHNHNKNQYIHNINKQTDSSEYNDKIIDSTDDEQSIDIINKYNKKNEKNKRNKTSNFVVNILTNRKSNNDNKKIQNQAMNQMDTTHLANRISDIQNKQRYSKSNASSNHSSDLESSRPSTITEIDIDHEIHSIRKQISSHNDKKPYISNIIYIVIYIINIFHIITSIWFLINVLIFSFQINHKLNLFMQILLYFNISMFGVLELWKLFAAILFNIECETNSKCNKLNRSFLWRLQFWIFLPMIWLINKSSYHLFLTLTPKPIEIWFDLLSHHIWMLLLCIMYILYPFIFDDEINNHFINIIPSMMYIITLCFIFIVTFIIKLRYNISFKT